jgi:hypothetical protein
VDARRSSRFTTLDWYGSMGNPILGTAISYDFLDIANGKGVAGSLCKTKRSTLS